MKLNAPKLLTANQLMRSKLARDYGRWQYNPLTKTARLYLGDRRWIYEVDFDRFRDSHATLDWILQLHGKRRVTDADMRCLLNLIVDVINPQATQCSWAMSMSGLGRRKNEEPRQCS